MLLLLYRKLILKKYFLLFVMFLSIILTYSKVHAYTDTYYIKNDSIKITSSDHNKHKDIGYLDEDIYTMSKTEFDKMMNMHIINTETKTFFIYTEKNSQTIKILTEEGYNSNLVNFYESGTIVETSKKMTITATYFNDANRKNQIYVILNTEWLQTPSNRYQDLFSILFSHNTQSKSIKYNGEVYPEFYCDFHYKEHYYLEDYSTYPTKITDTITTIHNDFDYKERNKYRYFLDTGIITGFDLQKIDQ